MKPKKNLKMKKIAVQLIAYIILCFIFYVIYNAFEISGFCGGVMAMIITASGSYIFFFEYIDCFRC